MEIKQVTPSQPNADKMALLANIDRNINLHAALFDARGHITEQGRAVLAALPLRDATGAHLAETRTLTHQAVEEALQKAFFKLNEASFSFQVATQGAPPTEEQRGAFRTLGMVDALTVPHEAQYDVGVVFGGLLGAVQGRVNNLLQQGCTFSSIALLGGQRALFPDKEMGEHLQKVIGEKMYAELDEAHRLPKTEFEMMVCVWESFRRSNPGLADIPVVQVDSVLRVGKVKEAPGTPDTVVDLANTLTSGMQIPGLQSAPSSFLLSSSQPHGVRQLEDFLSSMAALRYPNLTKVDVVAYERETEPSLMLYAQELAKLVHAQFLARY